MTLLSLLQSEAVKRGLLESDSEIDAAKAFMLVRDMPYVRASDRKPVTILLEWRGTCSGKHYLLKALFAELGLRSRVIACTATHQLDKDDFPAEYQTLLEESGGRFVDVHNYLVLELPNGEMIVDATWPLTTKSAGLTVNESFVLGVDHVIASNPILSWAVPKDVDPQAFKDELLKEHFTPEELKHRDEYIRAFSKLLEASDG